MSSIDSTKHALGQELIIQHIQKYKYNTVTEHLIWDK
jgi:hypothetical protein